MAFNINSYFEWLYREAFTDSRYRDLAAFLFQIDFYWSNTFDANRAADGISLRRAYLFEHGRFKENYEWTDYDCTFLEMFVGLAKKLATLLDKDIHDTMLHMLRNLDLDHMTNDNLDEDFVSEVATRVMDREYDYNGDGGFFPLMNPPSDQRNVELLYQMNHYILEYGW